MGYTEGPLRAQLFHRKRGDFKDAHADCSQYAATLCHWAGVADVDDTDWTGTLGKKGRMIDRKGRGDAGQDADPVDPSPLLRLSGERRGEEATGDRRKKPPAIHY